MFESCQGSLLASSKLGVFRRAFLARSGYCHLMCPPIINESGQVFRESSSSARDKYRQGVLHITGRYHLHHFR